MHLYLLDEMSKEMISGYVSCAKPLRLPTHQASQAASVLACHSLTQYFGGDSGCCLAAESRWTSVPQNGHDSIVLVQRRLLATTAPHDAAETEAAEFCFCHSDRIRELEHS